MLASTKYQLRIKLLISLGLIVIISVGILIPIGAINISKPESYFQYHQRPNETNLHQHSEKCDILKQANYELQNHKFHLSQNKQYQSHMKTFQEVGYQRTFWVYDFIAEFFYETTATLLAVGEYSLVFMENSCITELGELVALGKTETIRDEFDSTIYPRITELAGHPNGTLGDIDGDPRIVILLANCAHYYSERNELQFDYSNLCEMIYVHYRIQLMNVVAHEFHHLIWFNNEWDEPQFILEALAEYAMYYAGYLEPYDNLTPHVGAFLPHPEDSLLYWNMYSDDGLSVAIDYGSAYLFAFYIAEQYGVEILRNLIAEPTDGPNGIEAALQTAGFDLTFNELYMNWITALTIDEIGFSNNLYGFENLDARITQYIPVGVLPLLNQRITLRYYGFHIHKLQYPPDSFTVQIRKPSNQTIGVSIASHDTFGWHIYQNLHDEEDTLIADNVMGNQIDVARIITSYMLNHTPTTIRSDAIGLGPLTDIDISIIPAPITMEVPWGLIIPLSAFCGICILIVIVITIKKRKHLEEK